MAFIDRHKKLLISWFACICFRNFIAISMERSGNVLLKSSFATKLLIYIKSFRLDKKKVKKINKGKKYN
jgi:hypothetical protein